MIWAAEGLFIMVQAVITAVVSVCTSIISWRRFKAKPATKKVHWREMDYYYLEALNELNVLCPTDTEEEKGLARYLEFNDKEDHDRRLGDKQREPVRTGGTVSGGFTTLLAPGLGNALGGSLGGLGGTIGGLGGSLDQLGLGQQQQQFNQFAALAQQQSMMRPFSRDNDINPLANLAQALRESKKLDS